MKNRIFAAATSKGLTAVLAAALLDAGSIGFVYASSSSKSSLTADAGEQGMTFQLDPDQMVDYDGVSIDASDDNDELYLEDIDLGDFYDQIPAQDQKKLTAALEKNEQEIKSMNPEQMEEAVLELDKEPYEELDAILAAKLEAGATFKTHTTSQQSEE